MKEKQYEQLVTPQLYDGVILHTHEPFIKDYVALHCILKLYNPKSVFEIGTHIGEGTRIICNASPSAKVFSLDLPDELSSMSLQHPLFKKKVVGEICKFPYTQLLGNSVTFDYSKYPCEAYFIDGEHDYVHPRHETSEIIKQKPIVIVWHDADIYAVYNAIKDSFEWNSDYDLYLVTETRIAYAVRK